MRISSAIPAVVVLLSQFASAQAPGAATESSAPSVTDSVIKLADGTPVLLRTQQSVSSATARPDDPVLFRVTEDVKVGDMVVIRRGANAWGVVTAVKPKARKGVAGTLDVSIQSTHLLTGVRAPLRAKEHLEGGGRSMKSDSLEALADSRGLALPLLPLIRLEKGNDVTLPADAKVTAYVNGDVALNRADVERVQPPPIQRGGPATITIFRTSNSSGAFSAPSLYCGNVAVTQLWNGRYLRMRLPRGTYYFQSNENQVLELHVEEGQELYLQMQMVARGLGTKGHLVQVSNGEGEDEVAHLREMSAKNIAKISDASLADLQAIRQKK